MHNAIPVHFVAGEPIEVDYVALALPVDVGSLGGDLVYVHQITDEEGIPTVVDRTSSFDSLVHGGNQVRQWDTQVPAGALCVALVRTPSVHLPHVH